MSVFMTPTTVPTETTMPAAKPTHRNVMTTPVSPFLDSQAYGRTGGPIGVVSLPDSPQEAE